MRLYDWSFMPRSASAFLRPSFAAALKERSSMPPVSTTSPARNVEAGAPDVDGPPLPPGAPEFAGGGLGQPASAAMARQLKATRRTCDRFMVCGPYFFIL